jgi:hypothetical protein
MPSPSPGSAPPFSPARLLALAIPIFILLLARALTRDADPDEQQFVAPAVLTGLNHLWPYRDYSLNHTPALVWIYAPLFKLCGNYLLVARIFSAAVGTLTALMLYAASRRFLAQVPARTANLYSLGIVVLFLGARVFTYTNGWVWNHDASICALLAGVLFHLRGLRTGEIIPFALAGAFLALSVSIRLTTAPALGAIALSGLLLPSALTWRRKILAGIAAAAGLAFVLGPTLVIYRAAPNEFLFGNFIYPMFYKSYALAHGPHHLGFLGKIAHFFQTWCSDPGNGAVLILLGLALYNTFRGGLWRGHSGTPIATLILLCIALWFGVAAPFQIQIQYHSVLLPFFLLLIAAVTGARAPSLSPTAQWTRPMLWLSLLVLAVNFPRWYWPLIRLPQPQKWTTTRVMADSRWVEAHTPANALILTIDPILALEAHRRTYPQFTTGRFPLHVGRYMSPEDRIKYHVAWGPQLDSLVGEFPPDAVLYSAELEGLAKSLADIARARGFIRTISPDGEYILWTPPEKSTPAP